MDKSQVFIASSERAVILAEMLGNELDGTSYCEATLWTKESKGQPSATVIELLEKASAKYDFAIIVLAKDDVMVKDEGEALKARDNCVFEAGLFMGALGRTYCFLVNSVEKKDLPSDLGGIIYLSFVEPADLTDRADCAKALKGAVARIKDDIEAARKQRVTAKNKSLVNLLSWKDLIEKETLDPTKGGRLEEGQVVVTAIQPVETNYLPALQVRNNIDHGVSYVYFFHGNASGAQKICWLLQMVLLAPLFNDKNESNNDFDIRHTTLLDKKKQVLEDLRQICANQSIKIVALPDPPVLQYCIHNANNVDTATAYLKYGDKFFEWSKGRQANEFWNEVRQKYVIRPKDTLPLFYETAELSGTKQQEYYSSIDDYIVKYFPEIDDEVRKLCVLGVPKKK